MTYVDDSFAYLQGWSDTFMTDYAPGIFPTIARHGASTVLIPTKTREMKNHTLEYEFEKSINRSSRITRDPMAAAPKAGPGSFGRFNVRFNHTDPTLNDMSVIEVGFHTTYFDMQRNMQNLFKGENDDYVKRDVDQAMEDIKEDYSKSFHLNADGELLSVSEKKNDDSDSWAYATTYTSGSSTCLIRMNEISMARVGEGMKLDIRTAAGALRVNNVEVLYVHPIDKTISVKLTADSVDAAGTAVTNLDSVAATDVVYKTNHFGASPAGSLETFFDPDQNYYGRDRSQSDYKLLMPLRVNAPGATSTTRVALTADHFRKIGESAAFKGGNGNAVERRGMIMSRNEYRQVSAIAQDGGITITPALESKVGESLNKQFGFTGAVLHDANLGTVPVLVDDFAKVGKIDFLRFDSWEVVSPKGLGSFRMLPGNGAGGFWSRNTENDGSGVPSKHWSANGLQTYAFVCTRPTDQIRLMNLTTNAA